MSLLFGTLSESDLEDINRNVRTLAKNQKQIIHDLVCQYLIKLGVKKPKIEGQ